MEKCNLTIPAGQFVAVIGPSGAGKPTLIRAILGAPGSCSNGTILADGHDMPPPALEKRPPRLEQAGWPGQHPEVRRFLEQITAGIPQVVQCATTYFNPDLPERTRFRLRGEVLEGVYSDGRYCVRFAVETTAQTTGQRAAVAARLNQWLAGHRSSATTKTGTL